MRCSARLTSQAIPCYVLLSWLFIKHAGDLHFAAGWRAHEGVEASGVRWTTGDPSSLVVPIDRPADHVLTVEVQPGIAAAALGYANGLLLGERHLSPGWQAVSWTLPGHALRVGPNEIGFFHRQAAAVRDYARSTAGRPGWAVRHVHVRPATPVADSDATTAQ